MHMHDCWTIWFIYSVGTQEYFISVIVTIVMGKGSYLTRLHVYVGNKVADDFFTLYGWPSHLRPLISHLNSQRLQIVHLRPTGTSMWPCTLIKLCGLKNIICIQSGNSSPWCEAALKVSLRMPFSGHDLFIPISSATKSLQSWYWFLTFMKGSELLREEATKFYFSSQHCPFCLYYLDSIKGLYCKKNCL